MSSCVCKISFKSVQVCGGCCKMFRGLTFLGHSVCLLDHGRIQEFALGGRPSPLPFPLEVGSPLNQLWGLGSAVSSPSGVRGRAPAENEFGAL